jgi:hypothetical protein
MFRLPGGTSTILMYPYSMTSLMPEPMWKIFGITENITESAILWKEQLIERSRRKKGRPRFLEMMEEAKVVYFFDTIQEIHVFEMHLPQKYGVDDLEFMKAVIMRIIKGSEEPVISLFDEPQKYTVIITSEDEEDHYRGMR